MAPSHLAKIQTHAPQMSTETMPEAVPEVAPVPTPDTAAAVENVEANPVKPIKRKGAKATPEEKSPAKVVVVGDKAEAVAAQADADVTVADQSMVELAAEPAAVAEPAAAAEPVAAAKEEAAQN